ncbi:MAG: hypothetical protein K5695_10210 [Oscillospiraceae bacterium]|nr:hypothetical protein [Oscillospiraceae bacterium]
MNITIHSRKSLEKLLRTNPPADTVIISFYDPPEEGERPRQIRFSEWSKLKVFQVPLEDISFDATAEHKVNYGSYFQEADALASFVLDAAREGRDIICQCEDGRSLSAGCAAAIHEYLFGDGVFVFADYRYAPNQMVFHKVYNALWLAERN